MGMNAVMQCNSGNNFFPNKIVVGNKKKKNKHNVKQKFLRVATVLPRNTIELHTTRKNTRIVHGGILFAHVPVAVFIFSQCDFRYEKKNRDLYSVSFVHQYFFLSFVNFTVILCC